MTSTVVWTEGQRVGRTERLATAVSALAHHYHRVLFGVHLQGGHHG